MGLNRKMYAERAASHLSAHPSSSVPIPPKIRHEVSCGSDRLVNYCDPMCGRVKNWSGGILPVREVFFSGHGHLHFRCRNSCWKIRMLLLNNTKTKPEPGAWMTRSFFFVAWQIIYCEITIAATVIDLYCLKCFTSTNSLLEISLWNSVNICNYSVSNFWIQSIT